MHGYLVKNHTYIHLSTIKLASWTLFIQTMNKKNNNDLSCSNKIQVELSDWLLADEIRIAWFADINIY